MKRSYKDLADSLVKGDWYAECADCSKAKHEEIQTATMIDMMQSLRVVVGLLRRDLQSLEMLARKLVKQDSKPKKKKQTRNRAIGRV